MESGYYSHLHKLFLSDDDMLRESSDHKTAKVIGIIVGGAAIILLVLGICFLWRKKKLQCLLNLKEKRERRGNVQVMLYRIYELCNCTCLNCVLND